MKHNRARIQCCLDENGEKRPFHLCCPDCRKQMAAAYRAELLADGTAPGECGPEMIRKSPARGRVVTYRPTVAMPDGKGGFKYVDMGYRDRAAMVQEDVFDCMTDQAKRRKGKPPFTRQQVGAGRDYRALHERCSAAGYKCSKAFDDSVRGQGKVDFMDAYMRDTERLVRFDRAIGGGIAMQVRRIRPSDRGSRQSIFDLTLVRMVCLEDMALNAVLKAHGWNVNNKSTAAIRAALCSALDRMRGI